MLFHRRSLLWLGSAVRYSCTFRADRAGKNGCIQKKVGAFRANRTEKVGAFRANKTKKGGIYRGTYPYCFHMGVTPPPGGDYSPLQIKKLILQNTR